MGFYPSPDREGGVCHLQVSNRSLTVAARIGSSSATLKHNAGGAGCATVGCAVNAANEVMLTFLLGNKLLALVVVITLGLLLGRVRIAGLSLGSSGVIFTALAMGHFAYEIPDGIGALGLTVFVYCVGLSAGPRFFRVFRQEGRSLALICILLVGTGGATAWLMSLWLGIPADLAAGVFAGALTSTPGLAAAMEALPAGSQVAVGYGIAYPFGVICVVLFVQLLPRLLRAELSEMGDALASKQDQGRRIVRVLVEVCNPGVIGRDLSNLTAIEESNCQVARILKDDRLVPVPKGLVLAEGQRLLLVAREYRLPPVIDLLGRRDERVGLLSDREGQRASVVVTSPNIVGKTLDTLRLRANFGVTVTRITRHDIEFVPKNSDEIEYGDMLNAVGEPEDLESFAVRAGHRAKTFDETDLISLGVGIIAGVVLGTIQMTLGESSFSLGVAGGPLFVGLLLGHFGRIGPIKGHLPAAARMLMTEMGLVLFLAGAGVTAGLALGDVIRSHGVSLCVASCGVALVPMVVGALLAIFVFRMNLLQVLGVVCGGMTSTPGLGVLTAKTDSEIPIVSYAAAYPVALIVITVFAKILVSALA